MNVQNVQHVASRPSWDCTAGCGPWPCTTAQRDLRAQYVGDRIGLGWHVGRLVADAIEDLGPTVVADMWDRLVTWIRPRRRPAERGPSDA